MLRAPLAATPPILEAHRSTMHRRREWPATRGKSPKGLSANHFAVQNESQHRLSCSLPDAAESFRIANALRPMRDNPEARCEKHPALVESGRPIHTRRREPSNNSRSEDQSSQRDADM